MRKFGSLLRALAAALKASVMVPIVIGGEIFGWVRRSLGGEAAPEVVTEQTVEVLDAAAEATLQQVDDGRRDRHREETRRKVVAAGLPYDIKAACALVDAGRPIPERFFEGHAEEAWILRWVRSLDGGHRLAICSMPNATIVDHINGLREVVYLPAYQDFDRLAAEDRVIAMSEARRTMGWNAHDHFHDMLEDAIATGELDYVCQFDMWIEAQKRAGVPAEEIVDYAA